MRQRLRGQDQRRRSSTTCIGGITPDQLQQLRGKSPSSAAVSNLTNRRLKVSVDCDVTNRHPSKETIKIHQDDKSTRRLSRESSDGNKRFESPRRTTSAKQSIPDHGLQMKIIITLLIILAIVVTVIMLSYWIRRVT